MESHCVIAFVVIAGLGSLTGCSDSNPPSSETGGAGGASGGGFSGDTAMGGASTASGGRQGAGGSGAAGQGGTLGMGGTGGNAGAGGNGGGSDAGAAGSGGATGGGGAAGSSGALGSGGASHSDAAARADGAPGTGGSASIDGGGGMQHWLGTWTASPYLDAANPPPAALSNSVLRQVVHVSLGGSQLRVQLSNLAGNGPVTINAAHIALCRAAPAVDSTIDATTDKALAFSGSASVTIAQGREVWSDPIAFTVPPLGNVTITTAFGAVPTSLTQHSGSRTTSYLQAGSTNVSAANMTAAMTTEHWFYISGIDVMADASARGIVAIGDSITDGRGTDTNMNNRWTDVLAARLVANPATANVAMMNQGIGATNLVGTGGTAAQARFNRDVLGQSGVKYAIVFDGVNDIGAGNASFATLKTAYDDLIRRAHAAGLLIYGATITPFGGNAYYTVAHESVRQQVNTYIKSGVFDGVIDFDAALTDGGNPPRLQTVYATWGQMDGLHPGPAGYQKMGSVADLTLFAR